MGMAQATIDTLPGPEEPYAVWPENWDAVCLFLACGTQWRFAGMTGVPTGLDYGGLQISAAAMALDLGQDLFGKIRIMEGEALAVFAEKRR